jgi:hypothetical protein
MIRGDIANAIPRRILVTLRAITSKNETVSKKFLWFGKTTTVKQEFDREALSILWRFVEKTGVSLELIVFEEDSVDDGEAMALLESFGTSPINYAMYYKTDDDLLEDLPYRPEVLGVLDLPDRSARYGGWAITPLYFERVL